LKEEFDIIIITHLPSFYKINLYNALAKKKKLLIIFIGSQSNIRTKDFTNNSFSFKFHYLSYGNYENRNILLTCFRLYNILNKCKYLNIIINGWDLIEFWFTIYIFGNSRKVLALESSIYEYKNSKFTSYLKKTFLNKINFVLASGTPHKILLTKLNFKGHIEIIQGVGFTNIDLSKIEKKNIRKIDSFIYLGRLSKEKNLKLLFSVFANMPLLNLTIIGKGPEFDDLEFVKSKNITIIDHIPNEKIKNYLSLAHVLILPSISEPWGLVVEEALQSGLPVIVSNKVGCNYDIVIKYNSGLVFNHSSSESLIDSLNQITKVSNYKFYFNNLNRIDWTKIYDNQLKSYCCDF
jgi:glycosyltransferase involved in cell wall biosynthesis